MGKPDNIEILFVSGSSLDRRGKRVIVRDNGTLTYSLDEFHYDGGDAERFVAAADAIRSRLAPR